MHVSLTQAEHHNSHVLVHTIEPYTLGQGSNFK